MGEKAFDIIMIRSFIFLLASINCAVKTAPSKPEKKSLRFVELRIWKTIKEIEELHLRADRISLVQRNIWHPLQVKMRLAQRYIKKRIRVKEEFLRKDHERAIQLRDLLSLEAAQFMNKIKLPLECLNEVKDFVVNYC